MKFSTDHFKSWKMISNCSCSLSLSKSLCSYSPEILPATQKNLLVTLRPKSILGRYCPYLDIRFLHCGSDILYSIRVC